MNLSAVHRTCVCICGLQVGRSAIWNSNPSLRMARPHLISHRNMSLWYMAKNRIKRAWSEQVKIGSTSKIQKFGIEIGTADVLARMGARIQFTNGQWYTKADISQGSLPLEELKGHFVVAIDAKGTDLDQFSIVDVVKLSHLKYLSLQGCPLIDDHCLASLVHLRDTLTHLNVNQCPDITENGIGVLHKLRNLERLNMNDMPKVKHAALVAVMLEEVMPKLRISLVSQQVERYMEKAREGMDIINEHRRAAGLMDDQRDAGQSRQSQQGLGLDRDSGRAGLVDDQTDAGQSRQGLGEDKDRDSERARDQNIRTASASFQKR